MITILEAEVRYDLLIPRMMAVLATTSNPQLLAVVTSILERALSDSTYTFPTGPMPASESMTSLTRSQSTSISSVPSLVGGAELAARDQLLEDLGMRGLAELSFPAVRMER